MKWPRYYVAIDEKQSVLIAARGEKVAVCGMVYPAHVETRISMGKPIEVFVGDFEHPVSTQPRMFCDVHDGDLVYRETIPFVPDVSGRFCLEINTTRYKPGSYTLFHLYTEGENPAELAGHAEDFEVITRKELREFKREMKKIFQKP